MSKVDRLAKLRTFVLISTWAFAFGGFVFYAGVVVPLASQVVGTTTQGFVTQRVTHVLNIASLTFVAVLVWELLATRRERVAANRRLLAFLGAWVLGSSLALIGLHASLDRLLVPEELSVANPDGFYQLHRVYLWVSTLQWFVSVAILWMLVAKPQSACDQSLNRRAMQSGGQ